MFDFIKNFLGWNNKNFLNYAWWRNATPKDVLSEINKGADVNAKNKEGWTTLIFAVRYNQNSEIIRMLVGLGADVNAKDKSGYTALTHAVLFTSNFKIMRMLSDLGADVNAKDKDGCTVLMLVARFNQNPEIIRILSDLGADVNAKDKDGCTALMHVVGFNSNIKVVKTLLDLGVDINAKDRSGWTALMHAGVFGSDLKIIRMLLELGADVNAKDKDAWNVLMLVARFNQNPEIIKILTEFKANVNAKNNQTKFDDIKQNKKSVIFSEKNGKIADISKKTSDNQNKKTKNFSNNKEYDCLINAIEKNDIDGVRRYASPQYINKHNDDTFTPIMYAIKKKDIAPEILHILLSNGANLSEQYKAGGFKHTALQLAIMQSKIGNERPLEEISCFFNVSDKYIENLAKNFNAHDKNNPLNKRSNYLGYGRYDFSTVSSWSKGNEVNPDDFDDYS